MKLKEYYRKIDRLMLHRYPLLWVLGAHIYLPVIVLIAVIMFFVGFAFPTNPLPDWREFRDSVGTLNLFMVLPVMLLAITFVIRQIKFNSKRVHISLPYKHNFLIFLYFFGQFLLITALPFAPNLGVYAKSAISFDVVQYKEDAGPLDTGAAHFYKNMIRLDEYENYPLTDEDWGNGTSYHIRRSLYRLNKTQDSLILYRERLTYRGGLTGVDTISLEQAYAEMEAFISAVERYGAKVTVRNPEELLKINLAAKKWYQEDWSEKAVAYDHIEGYEELENRLVFYGEYTDQSSIYFIPTLEFWKHYSLLAFGLAVLLFIVCSVKISEFGWAMLVSALLPTIYGIMLALTFFGTGDFGGDEEIAALFWLIVFTVASIYVAFFSDFRSTLKRAFAISIHIYTPILMVIYLALIRELRGCCSVHTTSYDCDCIYTLTGSEFENMLVLISMAGIVVSTYFFGRYYKKQYIDPQAR